MALGLVALGGAQILGLTGADAASVPDVEPVGSVVAAAVQAPAVTTPPTTATTSAPPDPQPSVPVATTTTTTVAAQPPPPPPPPAPAPTPPPTAPAPAPTESLQQRIERALATGVPARWRADIAVHLEVIEGGTSWAHGDGRILVGRSHAEGRFEHLVDVVAHEFGHLIAFRYGTGEYPGAAPAGWPAPPSMPEEAWADCVQTVFTGRLNPAHGLPPCSGDQLSWARQWLDTNPG